MFRNALSVIQFIKEHNIISIDLKTSDLFGRWRHLTVPASTITELVLMEGFGFDGSSYGFKKVNDSDMIMIPDLSTGFVDPFLEKPTLSFVCNIHTTENTEPRFAQDPRLILQKAENLLYSLNIGDKLLLGPEYEFYLFSDVSFDDNMQSAGYSVNSSQASWNCNKQGNLGYYMPTKAGYHGCLPEDMFCDYRVELVELLKEMGIETKYHHHEVGGLGQMEIETAFGTPLEMADKTMQIKYSTKNLAKRKNLSATFMPKPMYGAAGSGFHVHFKLLKNGQNVFSDPNGYAGLSNIAIQFITGILSHARAISAFANPSTNSYKRLVPGYEAPVSIVFGTSNRSAAIRIPGYVKEPIDKRFEYRAGDSTANPYLMFAAMIMAGIDGIVKNFDPTSKEFGPLDVNLYDLPENESSKIKSLPINLEEALQSLVLDNKFLTYGDVFSADLLETWIRRKKSEELSQVALRPHPYEFFLSYNC